MLSIQKNLTSVNYNSGTTTDRIKYIVIHYTGNNGDTAWANTNYFKSVNRSASAHYFVDETAIWQCVEDKNIAWHCGANTYYNNCRNTNSIGVEMCSEKDSKGTYYFTDATVKNTIELVQYLMKKYNVGISNVVRHYDVTRKICPAPYCGNSTNDKAWTSFKAKLTTSSNTSSKDKNTGTTNTVTVTGATSFLRSNAMVSSKKLTTLKVGTQLIWLADDEWGWSKCKTKDGKISGWIQNSRLKGKTGLTKWRIATFKGAGCVNVRSSKSTLKSSNIMRTIKHNGTFPIIDIDGNWLRTNMTINGKSQDLFIYYDKSYIAIGGKRLM